MSALATFRAYVKSHSVNLHNDVLLHLAQAIANEGAERALPPDAHFDEAEQQSEKDFYKTWWHKVVDKEMEDCEGGTRLDKVKLNDVIHVLQEGEKARLAMLTANYRICSALKERNNKHKRKREEREAETEAASAW